MAARSPFEGKWLRGTLAPRLLSSKTPHQQLITVPWQTHDSNRQRTLVMP